MLSVELILSKVGWHHCFCTMPKYLKVRDMCQLAMGRLISFKHTCIQNVAKGLKCKNKNYPTQNLANVTTTKASV